MTVRSRRWDLTLPLRPFRISLRHALRFWFWPLLWWSFGGPTWPCWQLRCGPLYLRYWYGTHRLDRTGFYLEPIQ